MQKNKLIKEICIVSDSFIPSKMSAAGMIYNLGRHLSDKEINVTFIYGGLNPEEKIQIQQNTFFNYKLEDTNIISSKFLISFRNKTNFMRFIYEIMLSIILATKSLFFFKTRNFDLIIWYGPSSFLWFTVLIIKTISKAKVYYILRDIFPDWLINLKVVKNKIVILILKFLSYPQYIIPDIIGVETEENLLYLKNKQINFKKIEVLNNWPSLSQKYNFKINEVLPNFRTDLHKTINRLSAVYIGNTSIAHDYNDAVVFLLNKKINVKFDLNLFVTKKKISIKDNLNKNIVEKNWGQINDYYIPTVLRNVNFGIVTLNKNLITHNIPGKFISYVQFGLPVLCFANKNSSLFKMINNYKCGLAIDLGDTFLLNNQKLIKFFENIIYKKNNYSLNSIKLYKEKFTVNLIAKQIFHSMNLVK